ncbi:MAG: GntR family transcriptional regulator [Acidobacteriaceae bacterium]
MAILIAEIKGMIAKGVLTRGAWLPSEPDLAKLFHVNRASVRQILRDLEMTGFSLKEAAVGPISVRGRKQS